MIGYVRPVDRLDGPTWVVREKAGGCEVHAGMLRAGGWPAALCGLRVVEHAEPASGAGGRVPWHAREHCQRERRNSGGCGLLRGAIG